MSPESHSTKPKKHEMDVEMYRLWTMENQKNPQNADILISLLGKVLFSETSAADAVTSIRDFKDMKLAGAQLNASRSVMRKMHALFGIYFSDEKEAMFFKKMADSVKKDIDRLSSQPQIRNLDKTVKDIILKYSGHPPEKLEELDLSEVLQIALENAELEYGNLLTKSREAMKKNEEQELEKLQGIFDRQKGAVIRIATNYCYMTRPGLASSLVVKEMFDGFPETVHPDLEKFLSSSEGDKIQKELQVLFNESYSAMKTPDVSLVLLIYKYLHKRRPSSSDKAHEDSTAILATREILISYAVLRKFLRLTRVAASGRIDSSFRSLKNVSYLFRDTSNQ